MQWKSARRHSGGENANEQKQAASMNSRMYSAQQKGKLGPLRMCTYAVEAPKRGHCKTYVKQQMRSEMYTKFTRHEIVWILSRNSHRLLKLNFLFQNICRSRLTATATQGIWSNLRYMLYMSGMTTSQIKATLQHKTGTGHFTLPVGHSGDTVCARVRKKCENIRKEGSNSS